MLRRIVHICVSAGVFVSLAAISPTAIAASYTVVDLGALPGGSSTGRAINLAGEVVGSSGSPQSGISRAFIWTPGQGVQSLGVLAGGDYSDAFAINRVGQVTGASNTASAV